MRKYRILVAIGTRPEAIKLAPVVKAIGRDKRLSCLVCDTAQHRQMVDEVLKIFRIRADFDLNVMKPDQTIIYLQNTIGEKFSQILEKSRPDMVVVQGDTTTAFVAALVAFYHKVPVAHVEAGLRTFDKFNPFPEEVNRRLISVVGDLHFAPTSEAAKNLRKEGVPARSIHQVGNTVVDALLMARARLSGPVRKKMDARFGLTDGKKLVLVTAHRRENWGAPLKDLCKAVKEISRRDDVTVVWPVHPHPRVHNVVLPSLGKTKSVHLTRPIGYLDFVHLLERAHVVVTDSGGIQEEAASMGKPVLVFRKTTERPEVIKAGAGCLVPDGKTLFAVASQLLDDKRKYAKHCRQSAAFGDGFSSEKICGVIYNFLKQKGTRV